MKICFIGSHSTGKTTLCNLLAKELPDHFLIPEIARVFGVELIPKKTLQLQKDMAKAQINIEKYHANFISDRSILDFGIYSENISMINTCARYTQKSYDYIFYVPVTFFPVDDGFRNTDRAYQLHIAALFEKYLTSKTIVLKSESIEDRIEEIKAHLSISKGA